jgi:hypothetical protein
MTTQRRASRCRRLLALGLLAGAATAAGRDLSAQVVERDVSITGPKGNTLERHTRTERKGNVIDRQVDIRRPEGSYHRQTQVAVPPGQRVHPGRPIPAGVGLGPGPGAYRGPRVIERDIIVERPRPVGGPSFGLFIGAPLLPPPPPPVFFAPAPPPVVVYNPPVRYAPAPPPPPVEEVIVDDPVADAIEGLRAFGASSRRDAAVTLGKLGDARGVSPLIDRLKNDHDREVRMAAAWALAEIGDPRAVVPLEVAAQFDKRAEVRSVANKSLARMPREVAQAGAPDGLESAPPRNAAPSRAPADPNYNLDDLPPAAPTPAAPRSESGSGFRSDPR